MNPSIKRKVNVSERLRGPISEVCREERQRTRWERMLTSAGRWLGSEDKERYKGARKHNPKKGKQKKKKKNHVGKPTP